MNHADKGLRSSPRPVFAVRVASTKIVPISPKRIHQCRSCARNLKSNLKRAIKRSIGEMSILRSKIKAPPVLPHVPRRCDVAHEISDLDAHFDTLLKYPGDYLWLGQRAAAMVRFMRETLGFANEQCEKPGTQD